MKKRISRLYLLEMPLLVWISACAAFGPANVEPLYRVVDTPFSGGPLNELSVAARDIRRAATMLGWTVEDRARNEIIATNRKGKRHAASVCIRFDTEKFSISDHNSLLLDYNGERIHNLCNRWVKNLERAIQPEASNSRRKLGDIGKTSCVVPGMAG